MKYTLFRFGGYTLRTETPFAPAPVIEVWRDDQRIVETRLPMHPTDFAVGENGVVICLGDGEGKHAVTWQGWRDNAPITNWHYRQLYEPVFGAVVTTTTLGVVAALNTYGGALILWAGGHCAQKAWWALTTHNHALVVIAEDGVLGISSRPFATVKPVMRGVSDWQPGSKWVKLDGDWRDATEFIG